MLQPLPDRGPDCGLGGGPGWDPGCEDHWLPDRSLTSHSFSSPRPGGFVLIRNSRSITPYFRKSPNIELLLH